VNLCVQFRTTSATNQRPSYHVHIHSRRSSRGRRSRGHHVCAHGWELSPGNFRHIKDSILSVRKRQCPLSSHRFPPPNNNKQVELRSCCFCSWCWWGTTKKKKRIMYMNRRWDLPLQLRGKASSHISFIFQKVVYNI
jgi:hypothetical protein